jgi:hypothetical protein
MAEIERPDPVQVCPHHVRGRGLPAPDGFDQIDRREPDQIGRFALHPRLPRLKA